MKTLTTLIVLALAIAAQADDQHERSAVRRSSEPNWIIERQTAGQVQGVPTSRRIVGKRELDVYPDGQIYEKGNLVGITK
jgi:hypothetical protein